MPLATGSASLAQGALRFVLLVLGIVAAATSLNAQTGANPCPPVGYATGCNIILTVVQAGQTGGGNPAPCPASGCVTVNNTTQPPYDDIEDNMIGVINASKVPVASMVLTSTQQAFAFDGDGICGIDPNTGAPFSPRPPCTWSAPTTYEGPVMDATGKIIGAVSFSNYSNLTTGTVTFAPPIPVGGTSYFSLEEALTGATSCSDIINNSLAWQVSGPNICATFNPKMGETLSQAAQACGFNNFDWVQQITVQFNPSAFYARNLGGAFDPTVSGSVRLTSKKVPWSDPPQGGGYANGFGGGATPDNSYPFYYDQNTELAGHEDGSVPAACTLSASAGMTLTHHDAPADGCLPNGWQVGTATCMDSVLAPGATAEPKGSYGGYLTHLAGVNSGGSATDLGIGFTWTSNYNGSTGGASIKKTDLPADGNGTGGITITSSNQITSYQYPKGLGVTSINGFTVTSSSSSSTLLDGSQVSTTSSGLAYSRVSHTFNGTIAITNVSSGAITGPFQLVLSSLTTGVTLTNATSTFSGWPYITIPNLSSLASGHSVSVSVQFTNSSNSAINAIPLIYTGSFN